MLSRRKMTDQEIIDSLSSLSGWSHANGRLRKEFATGNFNQGIQFVLKVGEAADRLNHHPDILLTYPRVTVEIYTHDVGGITEFDFELARKIDAIATK